MVFNPLVFAFVLLALFTRSLAEDTEVTDVTYGSTIKLEHVPTKHRLHSHEVKYVTGSQQQSVTAVRDTADSNSFWTVKSAHLADPIAPGTPVLCGHTIRLQHLRTGRNLHSHKHKAPLSRDQEVSAFGELTGRWSDGDSGDNWTIECTSGTGPWKRGKNVRLRHVDTGTLLASSGHIKFSQVIPDQQQVSTSTWKNANTLWKTSEGFYIAPTTEK